MRMSNKAIDIVKTLALIRDELKLGSLDDVRLLLKSLWEGWFRHPDFDNYYDWVVTKWNLPATMDILSPLCMAKYSHPEGIRGSTSYDIGTPKSLLIPHELAWARRTLGELVGLEPLSPKIRLDPLVCIRRCYVSASPLRGGNGYECRIVLKALLPKKLHRWINAARKAKRRPKYVFLLNLSPEFHRIALQEPERWREVRKKKSLQPPRFAAMTKGELFVQELPLDVRQQLERYMSVRNFWLAATGAVASVDVGLMVTHQTDFLESFTNEE